MGEQPFGPRLDRIERCYLHLAHTPDCARALHQWCGKLYLPRFVVKFARALYHEKKMRYLVVRIDLDQLDDNIGALVRLPAGIDFVQVYIGLPIIRFVNGDFSVLIRYNSGLQKTSHEQRLERLMMRDGRSRRLILDRLSQVYVSDTPLSTRLAGQALHDAQTHGGWADDGLLYKFLGINHIPGTLEPYL